MTVSGAGRKMEEQKERGRKRKRREGGGAGRKRTEKDGIWRLTGVQFRKNSKSVSTYFIKTAEMKG